MSVLDRCWNRLGTQSWSCLSPKILTMIDGRKYIEAIDGPAPAILYGNEARLAYVLNPKAACTFAKNALFWANHNYAYINPIALHYSRYAFWKLGGEARDSDSDAALRVFEALQPKVFSFVRDPLKRLMSGFNSKLLSTSDPVFDEFRDNLTCRGGIDLSPTCVKRDAILRFSHWLYGYRDRPYSIDKHFRPQIYNLFIGGQDDKSLYEIDSIIRLEDIDKMEVFASIHFPGLDRHRELYNASDDLRHEDLMSDELKAVVAEIYKEDYAAFHY